MIALLPASPVASCNRRVIDCKAQIISAPMLNFIKRQRWRQTCIRLWWFLLHRNILPKINIRANEHLLSNVETAVRCCQEWNSLLTVWEDAATDQAGCFSFHYLFHFVSASRVISLLLTYASDEVLSSIGEMQVKGDVETDQNSPNTIV